MRRWVKQFTVISTVTIVFTPMLALLSYDIVLTFSTEVDKIWRRKFTGVTVLWFLVRWFYSKIPKNDCDDDFRTVGCFYVQWSPFMSVRVS